MPRCSTQTIGCSAATASLVAKAKKSASGLPIAGISATFATAGIALTMICPDTTRAKYPPVRQYQATMPVSGHQSDAFNPGSLEACIHFTLMIRALQAAGTDPTRAKIRSAIANAYRVPPRQPGHPQ